MSKTNKGIAFEITKLNRNRRNDIVCSVRAADASEAERIAAEDLGCSPLDLCAARICRTPRERGMFVKAK